MKKIRHTETLYEYDGPQVIVARDRIGGNYLGVAIESDSGEPRFFVVGVPQDRMLALRAGLVDLRTVLGENVGEGWWTTETAEGDDDEMALVEGTGDPDALGYLPDEGFILEGDGDQADDLLGWVAVPTAFECSDGSLIRLNHHYSAGAEAAEIILKVSKVSNVLIGLMKSAAAEWDRDSVRVADRDIVAVRFDKEPVKTP